MPKNRHLSYSDRQSDASRIKKQQQATPPVAPVPTSTPAPSETSAPVTKSATAKAPVSKKKKKS